MKKSKFLGQILSLTLAIALVVSIVPGVSAKAEENGTVGWTEVTDSNKDSLDSNLKDLSTLDQEVYEEFIRIAKGAHRNAIQLSTDTAKYYYILGKKGNEYVYLYKIGKDQIVYEDSKGELNSQYHYYYYPQCEVTFDLDGGKIGTSVTATAKTAGGMLMSLPTPTKEGYIFTGWYESPQSTEEVSLYKIYPTDTKISAHWYEQWPEGSRDWVRATTIKDLESADLPFFTLDAAGDFVVSYCAKYPLPEDAYAGVIGRCHNGLGEVCYMEACKNIYGNMYAAYYPYPIENILSQYTYYVLKTPDKTPGGSEEPSITPAPSTPAPSTPTPSTPAPSTPAPTTGNTSNTSSASEAPAPVLTTTNLVGEQISGWDAITKAISTQTKEKQQSVSGTNQDLLHVDASTVDKTIPVTTVKAVSSSSLRGLHVFIGSSDAVTFLAKNDLSGYKETSFDHKDIITGHTRTIEFTHKQALGATVVFHTTVPVKSGEVTVYKVDANNNKIQIAKTISTVNGQVCFPITETATYVLEY